MKQALVPCLIVLCAWSTLTGPATHAQPGGAPIQMIGLKVPWVLDRTKPGPYNRIADALFDGFPSPVELEIQPLMRAMRHFFEGDAECYFLGEESDAYFAGTPMFNKPVILSKPFNTVSIRIFSLDREDPFHSLEEVANKRVAVDIGVGGLVRIEKVAPNLTNMVDALSADQIFAMLSKGRAEAALMMDYDYALYAARHPDQKPLKYDPNLAIASATDRVMCKTSERTRALIDHINNRIDALTASGELEEMLYTVPGE
ncbi:MAG: transporter substrate-binding domain-containing protein [Kordiimonadaceae bacterium]|nr:transporter substrate-binding domain-containing protein [Kordiimonadaceae bacterium]MBO6569543.1 transporter substrate-binding domain-containing protein [Kordiimonadaceae bacterium]MBO6965018.1 transporter substrate-binding domain-containing protein [Kordiimonadaceae bacterium]